MSTTFERSLLKDVTAEARKLGAKIKKGYAHRWSKSGTGNWEFYYEKFVISFSANNAYEARAKGWEFWIKSRQVEQSKTIN